MKINIEVSTEMGQVLFKAAPQLPISEDTIQNVAVNLKAALRKAMEAGTTLAGQPPKADPKPKAEDQAEGDKSGKK